MIETEGDKCETKINQNVQKKTNLKTSLNNFAKFMKNVATRSLNLT